MAIPQVFHTVLPQDFTITPITVSKRYVVQRGDLFDGSTPNTGYRIWTAVYNPEPLKLGTARTYPTNSFDGTYQHVVWSSIDARYYRYPADKYATFEHANPRFTYKFLNYSASILVVPQHDFGQGILPGSVEITSSLGFNLTDDKNGNLYDPTIGTGSFTEPKHLVAWWDASRTFRGQKKLNQSVSNSYYIDGDIIDYVSHQYAVDSPSRSKNVSYSVLKYYTSQTASMINGEGVFYMYNYYGRPAYTLTDHRDEFNFPNGDFTIAFWGMLPDIQPNTGDYLAVITKNGVIKKDTFGSGVVNKGELSINSNSVYSQSFVDESTNVYPFDISLINSGSAYGKIAFRRSDGVNNFLLTSSIFPTDITRHYAFVKSGSLVTIYINGIDRGSAIDHTGNSFNRHSLMFGSRNQSGANYCYALLNDIRFYDKAYPQSTILTLAGSSSLAMKQTAVAGNVFYRSGNIVVSSHDPKYNQVFENDFTLRFRNRHTIYQWETLVRIPKGSFNLSQNPTALQHPYTDLLINEFTGSNPNSDLFPYATTIGLHNENKELLAVCKLSQPLKMRNDVDLNILCRFDT